MTEQREELTIKVPSELEEIRQSRFALAIGNKVYTLIPTDSPASELESVAKTYTEDGLADLRYRYQEAILGAQRKAMEVFSCFPTPDEVLRTGMMICASNFGLSVILPFKLKVTHYEDREILEPKIELDAYIEFILHINNGTLSIYSANIKTMGKSGLRPLHHYHSAAGKTCWGNYGFCRRINNLMELLPIRDRCEMVMANIAHGDMDSRDMPSLKSLKLGANRKVISVKEK